MGGIIPLPSKDRAKLRALVPSVARNAEANADVLQCPRWRLSVHKRRTALKLIAIGDFSRVWASEP